MKIYQYLLCIALLFTLTWGCSKKDLSTKEQPGTTINGINTNDPVVQGILAMGYKIHEIIEKTDRYVVQGDIAFPKVAPDNGQTDGHGRSTYVVLGGYRNINIWLDAAAFTNITVGPALDGAISAFNAVGSEIQFTRVYSQGSAHISILKDDGLGDGICGQAGFPTSYGAPYPAIYLNEWVLYNDNITDPDQLLLLVAHEMGHCIGMRHTNWDWLGESTALPIIGTPASDNGSVMNGASCGAYWSGLSYYDGVAINAMYATLTSGSNKLLPGETLYTNNSRQSGDGRFTLVLQGDGNLVLYKYNIPLWASNTAGNPSITQAVLQHDGNFVLYNNSGTSYWNSGTAGKPGGYILMQNDGNVVMYQYGTKRWATNTCCH